MKILVNATTCVVGGAVQVSVTFIQHALNTAKRHNFLFAVSTEVYSNLPPSLLNKTENIILVTPSPAKVIQGISSRKLLHELEKTFSPDLVFTVFGPAYMKFTNRHICGLADGWVTHPTDEAINTLSLYRKIRFHLITRYKLHTLQLNDYYWVEAEVARRGLVAKSRIEKKHIRVIPNTYSQLSTSTGPSKSKISQLSTCKTINMFTLAFPYSHKNISIIPSVIHILKYLCPDHKFNFIVTLPAMGQVVAKFWKIADRLNVRSSIQNIGPLKVEECPEWYNKSHIVFMPTLLETFSATYPEAMKMGKPIVTTDFDFSRNVCGDAALYYSPLSAEDAAANIKMIVEDQTLRLNLIQKGYNRLSSFPTPKKKYEITIDWLEEVHQQP